MKKTISEIESIIEDPFPVYCILALVCKNSKPGKSRIFHDL